MTREFMDQQLGRLVVLRGMPGDTDAHWDALQDIPEDVFRAGVAHALRSRTWFPVPAELRLDCDVARTRTQEPVYPQVEELPDAKVVEIPNPFGGEPLRIRVTREWRHDCETCGDTGWSSRQCPDTHCGRRFDHGPHEFVEQCACLEWNPTIRRRKEAHVKYHTKPEAA